MKDARARLEIAAVLLSVGLHWLAVDVLRVPGLDIAVVGGGWLAYFAWRA